MPDDSTATSTTTKVRAWTFTTPPYPQTLTLTTIDIPALPSPHHILIQTRAASLNPVDIQLMSLPLFSLPTPLLSRPKLAARDLAGTVLAVSKEVQAQGDGAFKPGDEVMGLTFNLLSPTTAGSGALAEVLHLDTSRPDVCLVRKPPQLSWAQAAALPLVYLTAETAVAKCLPFVERSGGGNKRVVVLGGSSATGMYMILLCKLRGWEVLSTCSAKNFDFVRERGADRTVDYTAGPEAVVAAVKDFKPVAIMDCVGGTDCIGLADQYISIVGDKTSRSSLGGSMLYLYTPRLWIRWFLGFVGWGKSYELISFESKQDWLQKATELKADDVIIDSTFAFDDAKKAFERLDTARARGKVIVELPGAS